MKRLNKFLLFCCLVFIASCDPNGEPTGCTDETRETFVMPTILEEYFGMYQEGNWWVYYNEDSTKIDSLFVSDYEDEVVQAEFECEQSTWSNYHINSTYLAPNNTPLVVRHKGYNCCNWNISWMSESNTTGLRVTTNTSANNENTIIVPLPNHTEQIDSILLDNKIYYDVLSIIITIDEKKGYFVKGIGLVQFEINNEIFNLKRYNIR